MEKIVFKNMYVNIVIGSILIIGSVLGYFMGWFEEFLPIIVASVLVLLSVKRFFYSFKKHNSKYAILILIIEFILDLVFAGLLIYLQDYVNLFIGLIIYIRGVAYLLINYIATRKIKLGQYLLNIGYVTLGTYLMFGVFDSATALTLGLAVLILIIGAIYLQAGLMTLVKKEEQEEEAAELRKEKFKQQKKQLEQQQKEEVKNEKASVKINKLEEEMKEAKKEHKKTLEETAKISKELEQTKKKVEQQTAPVDYNNLTVVELKALAKKKDLSGYSSMNKAELIKLLKDN